MNRPVLTLLVFLAAPVPVTGQVGHAPDDSPYDDIRTNQLLSFNFGYLAGSRGILDIAPANGPLGTVRFDWRVGTPTEITFGYTFAELERDIVDPSLPPDFRRSGPFTVRMSLVDFGVNLNLTGKKTWNRLSPYAGAFLGLAFGGTIASDPSEFGFNTKFYAGPQLGTRLHISSSIALRVEVKDIIWRVSYPTAFGLDDPNSGFEPPLAPDDPRDQWIHQPTISIGLGYAFRY